MEAEFLKDIRIAPVDEVLPLAAAEGFRLPAREVGFIAWMGLRGAVPIVLGMFPLLAGVDGAAALPGIARCVALEDSATGIASAVASGATTIAQLGFNRNAKADGPQCASIDGFAGITAEALNAFIRQRLGS